MGDSESLKPKYLAALRLIKKFIVHEGRPPSIRELQAGLGYAYPRSVTFLLEKLTERGFVVRRPDGRLQLKKDINQRRDEVLTVSVPLVGMAPCGSPLLAEQNIEGMVQVSTRLAKPSHRYFLLKAKGDSMNRAGIEDGDLVLVRQQSTANNGDRVVALIDGEVTIKRLRRGREAIRLEPDSRNPQHQPIILQQNFQVQGVVVKTI